MTEAIYRKVQRGKRVHYELIGNSKSYYDSHDVLCIIDANRGNT